MFCERPENLRRLLLVLSQGMVGRGLCVQALRGRLCVICLGSHAGTAGRKDAENENFMKWLENFMKWLNISIAHSECLILT